MTEKTIATPCQKRSIEKKNKIIEAALTLFNEKGYYQTVTTDIAARAGVSVGILYRYFKDKKDILLAILALSFQNFRDTLDERVQENGDIKTFFREYLNVSSASHELSGALYRELMALAYLDEDIADFFAEQEVVLKEKMMKCLQNYGYKGEKLMEKAAVMQGVVQFKNHSELYSNISGNKDAVYTENLLIDLLIYILEHE